MIWHSSSLSEIKSELNFDEQNGLSEADAVERIRNYGQNITHFDEKKSFLKTLAEQLTGPFTVMLFFAAALSVIVSIISGTGEWIEPIIILLVVALNASLGVFEQMKAQKMLDSIETETTSTTTVLRNSKQIKMNSAAIVPGDIIILNDGELIPADGRIIECSGLSCDESSLTGDSAPCEKDAFAEPEDISPLRDRFNMVYSGCTVLHGTAKIVVTDTGLNTEYGKLVSIARQTAGNDMPIKKALDSVAKIIGIAVATVSVLFLIISFITGIHSGEPFAQMLVSRIITSVSLAVAVMPESLPVVVFVSIALGIGRMMRSNAVIKNISKIEKIASVSVICADKTGTLTKNKMKMSAVYDGSESILLPDEQPSDNALTVMRIGALCCDASVIISKTGKKTNTGDATEIGIVGACLKYCGMSKNGLETTYPRMQEIPFDPERQLMTTINMINNRPFVIVKGSPDKLIRICVSGNLEGAAKAAEEMAENSLRVIAVGMKSLTEAPSNPTIESMESGLTFLGLFGLSDSERPETSDSLKECREAGINTVMMTGDNIVTATAAGEKLGLLNGGKISISGSDVEKMSDEELYNSVNRIGVYSRLSARSRTRIVTAFKEYGNTVAATGDEVKDSEALKEADIGFAMGVKGTDVAKSSADIVLSDDSFTAAVSSIKESRGIINNIKRSVNFLFSCNIGELAVMLIGVIIFRLPILTALQLLWINLITDCAPAVAIGTFSPDWLTMKNKPDKRGHYFGGMFGISIAVQSLIIAVITLISYGIGLSISSDAASIMAFVTLGFSQLFQSLNILSEKPLIICKPKFNKFYAAALAVSALLIIIGSFTPISVVFGGTAISFAMGLKAVALSVIVFAVVEIAKTVKHFLIKSN